MSWRCSTKTNTVSVTIIQTKEMPLNRDKTTETKKTIPERTAETRKGDGGENERENNTETEVNGCDITTTGIQTARGREDDTEH